MAATSEVDMSAALCHEMDRRMSAVWIRNGSDHDVSVQASALKNVSLFSACPYFVLGGVGSAKIGGQRDLNSQSSDLESDALPLRHSPDVTKYLRVMAWTSRWSKIGCHMEHSPPPHPPHRMPISRHMRPQRRCCSGKQAGQFFSPRHSRILREMARKVRASQKNSKRCVFEHLRMSLCQVRLRKPCCDFSLL